MSNIRAKNRQTSHHKVYYKEFRARYSGKLIRRKATREKRIEFFTTFPEAGSPSRIQRRLKFARIKQRKARKKTPK